jgi:hypothetical protein
MNNRVLVGTAPNQALGLMYQQMLQQAGIPVVSVPAQGLGVILNASPAEIYLEDPALANDPEVMATIRSVLNPAQADSIQVIDESDTVEVVEDGTDVVVVDEE